MPLFCAARPAPGEETGSMTDTLTSPGPEIPVHVPRGLVDGDGAGAGFGSQRRLTEPFAIWAALKDKPPLFWSASNYAVRAGAWVVTSADYCREVLQDPEHFSNELGSLGAIWPRTLIPLFLDPPEHGKYRALLAKIFSPRAIDVMESSIVGLAEELIGNFADRGEADFMAEFGRVFPTIVFASMMGLPLDERPQFVAWEHAMFQGATPEAQGAAGMAVAEYLKALIQTKRRTPGEDIISLLAEAEVDGKPIENDKLEDMCFLLFLAGLDTVAAALGHSVRYLAEHPELQARLRADPALVPDAVEELLRYHTWISTGRLVIKETDFHGVTMKPGDWVNCVLHAASHDPGEQDRPEDFNVTREPNRHFAFGAGVHRCAGSHLARRELRVAIRLLLQRLPTFRIKPGAQLRYDGGLVALGALPLTWDPVRP
jgi:cytochrome P450